MIQSPEHLERVGELIGAHVATGPLLLALYGPLGAGKTTLVRGLARGAGVASRVKSPSFTLHDQHQGRLVLDHFDAYFVRDPAELARNGLHEYLGGNHIVAIEWADRCAEELPDQRLEIHLDHDPGGRRCRAVARGANEQALWEAVLHELRSEGALAPAPD